MTAPPDHEADAVDEFTASLARMLHGPRRAKRRLLAEVGDGLRDAVAAHRSDGDGDAETALDRAVADFGRPHELVADFQSELTVRQARRTAAVLLAAVAGLLGCWHLLWVGAARDAWTVAALVAAAVPTLAAVSATGTLVLTGRLGRAFRISSRLPAVTAWTATAASVAMLAVSAALAVGRAGPALPAVGCALVTVILHGLVARSARSCRRCSAPGRWSDFTEAVRTSQTPGTL